MDIETVGSTRRGLALLAALLLALALVSAGRPGTASAHNDHCGITETTNWVCSWYDTNLAPGVAHWFSAANTLRNWYVASVSDNHGGSVTQKCVHVKRSSDGAETQVACGGGVQSGGIGSNWRPGWVYNRHGASGGRWIHSNANHPN